MKWYLRAFKLYAVFSGRDSRKAFWMFVLINMIVSLILGVIDVYLMLNLNQNSFGIMLPPLSGIYSILVFLPSLAISVRRLHDAGYSGWMFLLAFLPLIGFIILVMMFLLPSEQGPNRYGPPPAE